MFQAPDASRGKTHKGRNANQNGSDKRAVQKETKAQRKQGGFKRGDLYEVEDIGGMYNQDGEGGISVAPKVVLPEASESTSEGSESDSPDARPARGQKTSVVPPPVPTEDDEELQAIKEDIRQQLHEWANDAGMPLDEQKRCVRQLLAQWHPDKNRHIGSAAKQIFQFIQAEVDRIVNTLSSAAVANAKKEAERSERQAQRAAEKFAKASALQSAREEKSKNKKKKQGVDKEEKQEEAAVEEVQENDAASQEFSIVIGHGPATTAFLRPWPRSHFSMNSSPIDTRTGEILLFGGEAYDGRELMHYSDLYRLNLHTAEPGEILPWEKLYSSVPLIPGPEARSSHQAFTWDKFLFVFGGEWTSRDQKRYRQFSDLWRFDTSSGPGARWERLDAGQGPTPRSGHRMAVDPYAQDGHAVLFGGFSEDKKRRATYLDDLHLLHLPTSTWRSTTIASGKHAGGRAQKPSARAGGLVWVAGGATYVFGGTRLKKKGGDVIEILEDLWRAHPEASASSLSVRWQPLEAQGQGPGRRSGLSHCAVSSSSPGRRIVFGGVRDIQVNVGSGSKATKDVALFHNDVFLIDCETQQMPVWSRLWPCPGSGPSLELSPAMLPAELLKKGGGADLQALVASNSTNGPSASSDSASCAPRGRIAAGCVVHQGSLWLFGGVCESGPSQEVTLDDLWRLPLEQLDGTARSGEQWECVLSLSDRATMWFESESDDDSEDEGEDDEADRPAGTQALAKTDRCAGVLSKKQQKEEAHRARMQVKQEKMAEKNEEKTNKRELKKERQRAQARDKTAT